MENLTHSQMVWNESLDRNDSKLGSVPNIDDLALYFRVPAWTLSTAKVSVVVLFLIGIVGNSLLIAGLRRKRVKGSTDVYTIWKAVTDIITLVINGPVDFLRYTPELWSVVGADWLCRLHFYLLHAAVFVSTLLVFGIGVDRYWKVFKAHSSVNLYRVSIKVCLAVSGVAAVYSTVFIVTAHQDHNGQCILHRGYKLANSIAYGTIALVMLIATVVLAWVYFKIAIFLRNRERSKLSKQAGTSIAATSQSKTNGADHIVKHDSVCFSPSTSHGTTCSGISSASNKRTGESTCRVCNGPRCTRRLGNHTEQPKDRTHPTSDSCKGINQRTKSDVMLVGQNDTSDLQDVTPSEVIISYISHPILIPREMHDPENVPDNGTFEEPISVASPSPHTVQDTNGEAIQGIDGYEIKPEERGAGNSTCQPPISAISTGPILMNVLSSQPTKASNTSLASGSHVDGMKRIARTTLTMSLVTVVFCLSTVLPSIGLCILSLMDGGSELVSIFILLSLRLPMFGNVANPILFAMSSSEFRGIIVNLFKADCQ